MLNTVGTDFPFSWEIMLPLVSLAYNSLPQESTGETPHAMVFGRELRLPIALLDPAGEAVAKLKCQGLPEYIEDLQWKNRYYPPPC